MTSPVNRSGTVIVTSRIGSRSAGLAAATASLNAPRPAFLNATSLLSTGCSLPSNTSTTQSTNR